MLDLSRSRVLVTGGNGFLGRFVVEQLRAAGVRELLAPRSSEYDLRVWDEARRLMEDFRPDAVLHLAAVVGGIGANQKHPGRFFYDNAIMGIQLLELCRLFEVKKVLTVGTVCAYPKFTPVPFKEDDLWQGYPEETNAPYGVAKKALLVQSQAYRAEYGLDSIYLLPTNLYGPGDNFDLETSHVIPAMIRKFHEAHSRRDKEVLLWGDGSPTREFLYVRDAADGIIQALQRYSGPEPVNLGSGIEVSMRELADKISHLVGFENEIVWDTSRPNGQPRRCLDIRRAQEFGFKPETSLQEGLSATFDWYRSHSDKLRELTFAASGSIPQQ